MVTREQVYSALFVQLQTAGTIFKTYTRSWKSAWDDPQQRVADMPMLILYEGIMDVMWHNRGIGAIQVWNVKLELYGKIPDGFTSGVPDKKTAGATVLNPLIDAAFAALAPPAYENYQTLGGVVIDCRIEGAILPVSGDEDPSGLCGAIVPVQLLVNP